jgi:hypothetical protein
LITEQEVVLNFSPFRLEIPFPTVLKEYKDYNECIEFYFRTFPVKKPVKTDKDQKNKAWNRYEKIKA